MIIVSGIFAFIGIVFLLLCTYTSYVTSKSNNPNTVHRPKEYLKIGICGFIIFMVISCSILYIVPMYRVWQKGKDGEAALAEATANRQILIQEASAKEEAAKHLAEAEIIRSRGIAQANEIVSQSLRGNSLYLQYLYIQSLKESQNKVIYVPVSNEGLPILESARFLDDFNIPDQYDN